VESPLTAPAALPGHYPWRRVLLGLAVSAACLLLLVRQVDLAALGRALADADLGLVAIGIASLAVGYAARIVRWSFVLGAAGAPVAATRAVAPFLASIALNNVLPLRAGDIVRALVFPAAMGVPRTVAVASLVVERALDVGALAVMVTTGISLAGYLPLPAPLRAALIVIAVLVPVFFVLAAYLAPMVSRQLGDTGWRSALATAARDLGRMAAPKPLVFSILLSAVVWIFEAGLFWAVLHATGIAAPFATALAVCGAVTLVTIVPSSPGYVGTFHAAAYAAALATGGSGMQAAAFAVLAHLALWLPTSLAGALAMLAAPGLLAGFRKKYRPN
jgi:uncharacterized membrane protein YbhN (UPF0104 family)